MFVVKTLSYQEGSRTASVGAKSAIYRLSVDYRCRFKRYLAIIWLATGRGSDGKPRHRVTFYVETIVVIKIGRTKTQTSSLWRISDGRCTKTSIYYGICNSHCVVALGGTLLPRGVAGTGVLRRPMAPLVAGCQRRNTLKLSS